MILGKVAMSALTALAMTAMPAFAQAGQANHAAVSKLSVARVGTVARKSNDLRGGSIIIGAIAVAALIGGIVLATGGGSNSP